MVLRSNDGGQHWTPAAQGLPEIGATVWALDPQDPNNPVCRFLGLYLPQHRCGRELANHSTGDKLAQSHRYAPSDPNTIYLGGQPAQRSTDRGATWQSMPIVTAGQLRQTQDVTGLVVDPADPRHVWARTGWRRCLRKSGWRAIVAVGGLERTGCALAGAQQQRPCGLWRGG